MINHLFVFFFFEEYNLFIYYPFVTLVCGYFFNFFGVLVGLCTRSFFPIGVLEFFVCVAIRGPSYGVAEKPYAVIRETKNNGRGRDLEKFLYPLLWNRLCIYTLNMPFYKD